MSISIAKKSITRLIRKINIQEKDEFNMNVIKKKPSPSFWFRKSLSFSAEEIANIAAGEVEKIIVLTPALKVYCEITSFENILGSVTCKGDYYVAQYKAEDTNY